jgi:outer membrane lipoprotein-sorting protein
MRISCAAASAAVTVTCCLALCGARAAVGSGVLATAALTAEEIVDKSVEVRGGLQAWQRIATIIWVGHLESERSLVPSLPFRLEEKRPGKSRFEITEPSQRSLRVFDGTSGWKMRLGQDGRPEVKRFTPEEVRFAREAAGLEGPLIDFRAKGSTVELEGTDPVDGGKAYRIGVRLASGERQTVWIDAATFLEARYDRTAYGPTGAKGTVSVRYRNYKEVEGLALPSLFEISGAAGGKPDRMVIERVALNPQIDDREFAGLGVPRDRLSAARGTAPR